MRNDEPSVSQEKALQDEIELRRTRQAAGKRDGERPLAQNLAMIGALGWLIVLPTLGGIFAGQWLDRRTGGGLTFTAAFLFVGLVIGASLAWQRMHRP